MNMASMFRLAKNISKISNHRYKMGAVIVKNGNVISVGTNQLKTHPEAPRNGLHCEIHAIKCSGKYDLKGSSIFVYRETRKGKIAKARPCIYCMEELKKKGFKSIFYTIDEYPFFESEKI